MAYHYSPNNPYQSEDKANRKDCPVHAAERSRVTVMFFKMLVQSEIG